MRNSVGPNLFLLTTQTLQTFIQKTPRSGVFQPGAWLYLGFLLLPQRPSNPLCIQVVRSVCKCVSGQNSNGPQSSSRSCSHPYAAVITAPQLPYKHMLVVCVCVWWWKHMLRDEVCVGIESESVRWKTSQHVLFVCPLSLSPPQRSRLSAFYIRRLISALTTSAFLASQEGVMKRLLSRSSR